MRRSIMVTILFLTIGFATISTTLLIRSNTSIGINEADFNVHFFDVKVNGEQNLNVITSERELTFFTVIKSKNEVYVLDYDVINGSKNYDAKLEMTCTGGNEYLSVINTFDTVNNLLANQTRSGTLTIKLTKQYTGDFLETEVSCIITATGVERTELDTGSPEIPVKPPSKWLFTDSDANGDISIGDEIILASNENEKFNVISQTDDTVTMLASYALGTDYRQTASETVSNYGVSFSNVIGWEYSPGPKEIDIQLYDGAAKTYINEYVSYLQNETGDITITGNLITLKELGSLGCVYPSDYGYVSDSSLRTCNNSRYVSWLVNNQKWWTRSADPDVYDYVWLVFQSGKMNSDYIDESSIGIRPVITILKENLDSYYNS